MAASFCCGVSSSVTGSIQLCLPLWSFDHIKIYVGFFHHYIATPSSESMSTKCVASRLQGSFHGVCFLYTVLHMTCVALPFPNGSFFVQACYDFFTSILYSLDCCRQWILDSSGGESAEVATICRSHAGLLLSRPNFAFSFGSIFLNLSHTNISPFLSIL